MVALLLGRADPEPQQGLFEVAQADVVVPTDAETRFAPGALARLVVLFGFYRGLRRDGPLRVARRSGDGHLPQ